MIPTVINALSALFAIVAAGLWFKSATIKMPTSFTVLVSGAIPELNELARLLVVQSMERLGGSMCCGFSVVAGGFADSQDTPRLRLGRWR